MKKILNKTCAILILIIFMGINLLPNAVYATNTVNEIIETNQVETVAFDATINNHHTVEADISEELLLELNVLLNGDGYLKNVKVTLENGNYVISKTADEINEMLITDEEVTNVNKIINSIEDNEIALKEIDSGELLNASIPIKFNKTELASKEEFEKDSTIKLSATYVNGKDDDKTIEKTITEHIKWNVQAEDEITQELVRYLKYDDKTMVSFEITDGIKDSKIPVESKEIDIAIPSINNQKPEHITVAGQNVENEQIDGILKITQLMEPVQGGKYDYNSTQKYTVTYIYNTQTESTVIEEKATSKVTTVAGDVIESEAETNNFEVSAEIGSIVQADMELPAEINKGYIYTNLNRPEEKLDTDFKVNYKINIGYAELTDKITLSEGNTQFNNENGEKILDATDYIRTGKVTVDKDEIVDILGDEGSISIKNTEGEEIGTLNKNKTSVDLDANLMFFEISNPQKEGNLNISVDKVIKGDNNFQVNQMVAFRALSTIATIKGYNSENEITNRNIEGTLIFTEPTSKASIDTNTDALSTVSGNKDVEINVVLNRTDISDALYINPTIKITLPEEVTNITLKSAKIVYDEELLIEKVEQNGRDIIFTLTGTQTEYNTLKTTKGTLLRIVADLGLDLLAPSNESKITMEYTNEFTAETKISEKAINIVAPTQMVTTNQIDIDGQTAFALDSDADLLKIKNGQGQKTMQITGQIVNNMGIKAEGVQIIGRIPSSGNKTIGGAALESNINTTLATPIELAGFTNAQVYYSPNIEEALDGEGWQTQATTDTKSFKIVLPEGMENKTAGGFRYTVSIPANLDYEQVAKTNYGLYYNNNAQQGVTQNLVESKVLGIETGKAPEIKVNIRAYDTNEGYEIKDGGTVKEGQYITYRVNVQNTGTQDANDVKVKVTLPYGVNKIGRNGGYIVEESWINDFNEELGTLKGGESKNFEFDAQISKVIYEVPSEIADKNFIAAIRKTIEDEKNIKVDFETSADILEENLISSYTVINSKGNLSIKLTSDADEYIEPKQNITYIIKIDNVNQDEKNNTKVSLKLPDRIKYVETEFDGEVNYDESSNIVTVSVGKLESRITRQIKLQCYNNSDEEGEFRAQATAYCDETTDEIKSNIETHKNNVTKKVIEATQAVNISNGATDNDEIEFYMDMKNTSNREQQVEFSDSIPAELEILEYTVTINGETVDTGATNYITELLTIPANGSARIIAKTKPFPIDEGTTKQLENKPTIIAENDDEINIDLVSVEIEGTTPKEVGEIISEGSNENSEIQGQAETYKIAGNIWIDENRNGEKDSDEGKLSGITVKLIDAKTNETVKNRNGEEITATTNTYGEYLFQNLQAGNYIVQALYDNKEYEIGEYKADNVDESLNSDFVGAKINDKLTAVTDVIKLKDTNIFNIDLGLVRTEQLNLSVNQSISKISVAGASNKARTINFNETTAKLELTSKEIENSTVLVEYNIKVTNYGDVAGYAKQIIEYVPTGMKFNSEINKEWYMDKNGNLNTVNLSNEMIEPGESKNVKLVLSKSIDEDGLGVIRGRAEIKTTYSETGLAEISALSANVINSESDITTSDVIILKKINIKGISVAGITLGLFALLILATYEIKKHIINKMYNIDNLE